jgi:GH15 family glucan-1,4-alpha-glucosidase
MGRPVVLSNGSLYVGLNEHGLVHDFYYPYIGQENLTTARSVHHKIGIWVDNQFSWVDEAEWERDIDFDSDSLVSKIRLNNPRLNICLDFNDFVDSEYNAFCRSITVTNNADYDRDIRLFMHQVFQISREGRADTALFVPEGPYLFDYKGRCSLLIYGQDDCGQPFDQYAIGNYGIEGKEGTFRDAEDGELSGNPVEHGGVDTVMRLRLVVASKATAKADYWIVAAGTQQDARKIHLDILKSGIAARLSKTKTDWAQWLSIGSDRLHSVPKEYLEITKKSMMVIKAHVDKRGSILASGDSSIFNYGRDYYCYFWPRDGAYAMWPLIRMGYSTEAKNYFEFCRDVMHPDGYLEHKFMPDRSIGSTWHPLIHGNQKELAIQEDETAGVIYMLNEYLKYTKDDDFVSSLYLSLVQPAANFMSKFFDPNTSLPHASYDLWEEKFATHTYSVSIVQAALRAAAMIATKFGYPDDAAVWSSAADKINFGWKNLLSSDGTYAAKSVYLDQNQKLVIDNTIDASSMYGLFMYADVNEVTEKLLELSVKKTKETLVDVSPSGGVPRYNNDWYMRKNNDYTGNPWFICTLWQAQYACQLQDYVTAKRLIDWTTARATPSGILSEQIHPVTSAQLSVAPLVWSHAELINTILDLK